MDLASQVFELNERLNASNEDVKELRIRLDASDEARDNEGFS